MKSSKTAIGAVRAATLLATFLMVGVVAPGRAAPAPVDVHPPASGADPGGNAAAASPAVEARREQLKHHADRIAARRALIQRVRAALAGRSVAPSVECPDGLDEVQVQNTVLRLLREEIADLDRRTGSRSLDGTASDTRRESGIDPDIEYRLRDLERSLDRREREVAALERQLESARRQEVLSGAARSPDAPGSSIVPVPVPVPVESSRSDAHDDELDTPGGASNEALPDVRVIRESFLSSGLFSSQLILFETAKDRLLTISGPVLDAVAEVLREFPDARVRIEGHTDIRGGAEYNRQLSERRAASVRNYLVDAGRIDAARLTTIGLGFDRPLMDGTTPTAHALNRRVTLRILNPSALSAPVPIRN